MTDQQKEYQSRLKICDFIKGYADKHPDELCLVDQDGYVCTWAVSEAVLIEMMDAWGKEKAWLAWKMFSDLEDRRRGMNMPLYALITWFERYWENSKTHIKPLDLSFNESMVQAISSMKELYEVADPFNLGILAKYLGKDKPL